MARREVYSALKATGLPVAYRDWGDTEPPDRPYVVYYSSNPSYLYADDANYCEVGDWTAELYSDAKDEASEAAVEHAIASLGATFSKNETGRVSESAPLLVAYYFTTI